jgi:hypothetical protein
MPENSKSLGGGVQVSVNTAEGLKHESAIQCDGLMSLEKFRLTLATKEVNRALSLGLHT